MLFIICPLGGSWFFFCFSFLVDLVACIFIDCKWSLSLLFSLFSSFLLWLYYCHCWLLFYFYHWQLSVIVCIVVSGSFCHWLTLLCLLIVICCCCHLFDVCHIVIIDHPCCFYYCHCHFHC